MIEATFVQEIKHKKLIIKQIKTKIMKALKSILKNNSIVNWRSIKKNNNDENFLSKYDNDEDAFLFI